MVVGEVCRGSDLLNNCHKDWEDGQKGMFRARVVTLNYQKDGGQDDYDRKRIVICVHGIVWGDSREYQSDGNW